jgi:hypothetical protein
MAWQLIYTSAPRLLEAGRTGFGTIARHRDIPTLLVQIVERFSQFARLPGLDPHRVIYCHRKVRLSSGCYHVLSMIRSAGSDHTGRTNDIAHHLIATEFEAAECVAAGVTLADIMLGHNWLGSWGQPPRWLDDTEMVKLDSTPLYDLQYSSWVPLTNNPEHAWLLVTNPAGRSCHLIAPTGVDLRLIFLESLRVMGSESWQATFTTSAEPTDDIGDFRWIACAAGSSAAISVNTSGRPVLDLTKPDTLPQPEAPQVITAPAESVSTETIIRGSIQKPNLSFIEQPAVSTRDAHGNYRDQVKLRLPAPSAVPLPMRQGASAMTEGRRDFGVVPHSARTHQGTIEKKKRRQPSKLTLTLIGSALVVVAILLAYPLRNKYFSVKEITKPNGNVAVVNGTAPQTTATEPEKSLHPSSAPATPKNPVPEKSKQTIGETNMAVPIPVATSVPDKGITPAMVSNNTPPPKTPVPTPLAGSKSPKAESPTNRTNLKKTRSVYLCEEFAHIILPINDTKKVARFEIETKGGSGVSALVKRKFEDGYTIGDPLRPALFKFSDKGTLIASDVVSDDFLKLRAQQIRKMSILLADESSISVYIHAKEELKLDGPPLLAEEIPIQLAPGGIADSEAFKMLEGDVNYYLKIPDSLIDKLNKIGPKRLPYIQITEKSGAFMLETTAIKKALIDRFDFYKDEAKKFKNVETVLKASLATIERDLIDPKRSKDRQKNESAQKEKKTKITENQKSIEAAKESEKNIESLKNSALLGGITQDDQTYTSTLCASITGPTGVLQIPFCKVQISQKSLK